MTDVTVTEAIAYDCGHRAGHAARDTEVEALRARVAELEDVIKHALYTHETSGTIAPSSAKKMRAALKGRTDGRD